MDRDYKQVRDAKYKQDSKDRLSKILKKKIQTTMIGALSTIEENFGFLWNNEDAANNEQEKMMKELYNKVRSEILDRGNNQARNIDAELAQYEVEWTRYQIKMDVQINGHSFRTTFNLSNRSKMRFPTLLGRKLLGNRFIVDVTKNRNPKRINTTKSV